MTEDSRIDKFDELLDLTRENNRILRGMRRQMIWSQVFTYIYWLFILGAMGWSYYYFQPYLQKYWDAYQKITKTLNGMEQGGTSIPSDIKGLLDKVR